MKTTKQKHDLLNADLQPSDTEAEKLLIACLLTDSRRVHEVSQKIGVQDFIDNQHRAAYAAILDLMNSGLVDGKPRNNHCPLDVKPIQDRVREMGLTDFKLFDYADVIGTGWDYMYYAHRISEMSIRRAVVNASIESIQTVNHPQSQVAELLDSTLKRVSMIGAGRGTQGRVRQLGRVIQDELMPKVEKQVYGGPDDENFISTGWQCVDRILGRMHKGSLYILAGRPGQGKTSFACNIAAFAAINESRRVLFLTLEQSQREIAEVVWRSMARVGALDEAYSDDDRHERLHKLLEQTAVITSETFLLWEGNSVSVEYIEAICRTQSVVSGVDLVVIDYLGLIRKPRDIQGVPYQIEFITGRLKALAKQLQVPILLLCQLSRDSEKPTRDGKSANDEPLLRHLSDSSSIEKDADAVIMVWRPGRGAETKIKIAKNRHGVTGMTQLDFVGEFKRFFEPEPARHAALDDYNNRSREDEEFPR